MFGLNKREHKFFRLFAFGHLLLGVGLIIFSFLPSCEKKPEEIHIFELASTSTLPEKKEVPPRNQSNPPQVVAKKPLPPLKVAPKPKLVTTPPKVNPKSKPKSKPKIDTAKPKPITKPAPKPKPISFEQFRKDRKLPTPSKPRPPTPTIKPIKLNPKDFSLPQIKVTSVTSLSPSVSASAINQYLAGVKAKLEGIWRKLLMDSALNDGGEARLSFRISESGALLSPRLTKSSGNLSLDRLVLEVARRGGAFGPPPGGSLDSVLEIPFRVQ